MKASEIAAIIKEKYSELGITQASFCEQADIRRQTLHYWEKDRSFPSIDTLERINGVLGTSFTVMEEKKEKPAPSEGDGNSEEDAKILTLIRHLDRGQKLMLIAQLETLVKAQEASQ